mgnify:CR=1 FL=1
MVLDVSCSSSYANFYFIGDFVKSYFCETPLGISFSLFSIRKRLDGLFYSVSAGCIEGSELICLVSCLSGANLFPIIGELLRLSVTKTTALELALRALDRAVYAISSATFLNLSLPREDFMPKVFFLSRAGSSNSSGILIVKVFVDVNCGNFKSFSLALLFLLFS